MSRTQIILVVLGIAALVAAPLGQGNYIIYTLTSWLLFSISAMGLNLTLGYAGQVSLAQAAFMGIGAYITALLTLAGVPWIAAALISITSSFAVGLLLGYPALRENPIRAESLGLKIRRQTLLAFAIGSAFGGLAGALQSPLVQFIEPGSFALIHSLKLLLMVVVGGAGFFFGPMLGAAVVILLPELLRFTEGYYLIIYSLLVIVLMVFSPSGLIGLGQKIWQSFRPRHEERRDMKKGFQL